jgi:hypothetical protein
VQGDPTAIDELQRNNVHSFQRPDSDVLTYDPARTSLGGQAGSLSLNKISGQTTRFQSVAAFKTPGFEINDLGFMQRADEITQSMARSESATRSRRRNGCAASATT